MANEQTTPYQSTHTGKEVDAAIELTAHATKGNEALYSQVQGLNTSLASTVKQATDAAKSARDMATAADTATGNATAAADEAMAAAQAANRAAANVRNGKDAELYVLEVSSPVFSTGQPTVTVNVRHVVGGKSEYIKQLPTGWVIGETGKDVEDSGDIANVKIICVNHTPTLPWQYTPDGEARTLGIYDGPIYQATIEGKSGNLVAGPVKLFKAPKGDSSDVVGDSYVTATKSADSKSVQLATQASAVDDVAALFGEYASTAKLATLDTLHEVVFQLLRKVDDNDTLCWVEIGSNGSAPVPYFDEKGVKRSATFTGTKLVRWNKAVANRLGGMFDKEQTTAYTAITSFRGDVTGNAAITNTACMFRGCTALRQLDVAKWDMSKVENASSMFQGCMVRQLDVAKWDMSAMTDMGGIFRELPLLEALDVSRWNVDNCKLIQTFVYGCKKLTRLDVSRWSMRNATDVRMFSKDSGVEELDWASADFGKCTTWGTAPWAVFGNELKRLPSGLPNLAYTCDLSLCKQLETASKVNVINAAKDLTGGTAQTIKFSSIADLTAEQIAVATSKNWTVTA